MKAIEKMDEEKLTKAFECIKGDASGTTEQKLKKFSPYLFGNEMAEIDDL